MSLPVLQLLLLFIMAMLFVGLVIWCVGKVMDVLAAPVVGPEQKLIGQTGRVIERVHQGRGGKVVVAGEIWDAVLANGIAVSLESDTLILVTGFDPIDPRTVRVEEIR